MASFWAWLGMAVFVYVWQSIGVHLTFSKEEDRLGGCFSALFLTGHAQDI